MSLAYSTASAVLKEDYQSPLRDQLNRSNFLLNQIEKNTDDVQGLRAYHALHVKRSSGIGSRASTGTLPDAGNQTYVPAYIPVRFHFGRIKINDPVIEAMRSDRGSFIRAIDSETKGIKDDLKHDLDRQLWGTSNGVIATCGTTSASTTLTLASTTTETQILQIWSDGGIKIDVGTVANPTLRAQGLSVTGYSLTAKTLTVSTAVTTAGTDFIFRTGNGGASAGTNQVDDGQVEFTGLQNIVDDTGNLHGVNATTYPVWLANVLTNSGTNRAISENLINSALFRTNRASGSMPKLLCGNFGVVNAITTLMTSMRRNIDNVDLKGGFSGIKWSVPMEGEASASPVAIYWARNCPENKLFGLDPESLVQYEAADWSWMDRDGSVLSRVPNEPAYEATLRAYKELACYQRNANFLIEDITQVVA